MAGGQILAFPIDFDRRPYNTLALPCECVICVIPADTPLYCENNTAYLLHQVDTFGKCGHFDLLVRKNTSTNARLISMIESGDTSRPTTTASSDLEEFGLVHLLSCVFTTEGVSLLNAEVLDECAAKSQQKWCHCHQSRVGLLRNKLMSYQRHKMVARSSSQGDKAASSNNGSRAK